MADGYSELDRQYSPRLWVHRMHESLVVPTHMKITGEASEKVRSTVPYEPNVRYGSGPLALLDIFGGDSLPNDAPIFVFIHGGYWQHLNKEISCYPVLPFFEAGIRVIIVGYDLAPNAKMSDMVEEIKQAGNFIMKKAEVLKSSGVWFSGFSAGGHLTGILLTSCWIDTLPKSQSSLIKGFLPISGIFDLRPILKTYINEPIKMDEEEAAQNSPMCMNHIKKYDVEVLVIYAQYDSPEFHAQSEQFTKKLQDCQLNASTYKVPEVDHFTVAEGLITSDFVLTKRLVNLIKGQKSE